MKSREIIKLDRKSIKSETESEILLNTNKVIEDNREFVILTLKGKQTKVFFEDPLPSERYDFDPNEEVILELDF